MKTNVAVALATLYLFTLTMLGFVNASDTICAVMYLFSPVVIIGLVYTVLREKNYHYPELPPGEEWGYSDKNKNELDVF
jgi:hypothetical protein